MAKIVEKRALNTLCEDPTPVDYHELPAITKEDYQLRMERLWDMPQAQEYRVIVIYGDREHFSNLYYFTGYDPRFEEALLILKRGEMPVLVAGNEGMAYAQKIPYEIRKVLYQTFSLMGQPDEASDSLEHIFRTFLGTKGKVGLVGWKTYKKEYFRLKGCVTDVPNYIVETMASILGRDAIENATDLLTDNEYGLRHHVSAKEIVWFEAMGTKASRSVYRAMKGLKPGMSEIEASGLLGLDGEPLAIHPNVNFGDENVACGLASPCGWSKLEYGIPLSIGCGLRGANIHRAGMYIRSLEDLPAEKRTYMEKLLKPYYFSIALWYEMMEIGTDFGSIYDMVEQELGFEKFGIVLNPGHYIHTEEWTNSPFGKGNTGKIASGQVLQCDYSASFKNPYLPCHIEDGIAIADENLQDEIYSLSAGCYARMLRRGYFMREVLGIRIPSCVLPLSDLPAMCFPYMADTMTVLAVDR